MLPQTISKSSFPTGSNYICNPPVTNTDIDTMYYVFNMRVADAWLTTNGWTRSTNREYPGNKWKSYRKDNLNALITDDPLHFAKFYHATELAKALNLLNKADRIDLFHQIVGE